MRHFFAFLVLFLAISSVAKAELSISDIRIGQHTDKTRIVVDMNKRSEFRTFLLDTPYRLVIDTPQATWTVRESSVETFGGVKSIRHGNLTSGGSRIAIDLSSAMQIEKAFTLPAQDGKKPRLVIDIAPVSRSVFVQNKSRVFGSFTPTDQDGGQDTGTNTNQNVTQNKITTQTTPPPRRSWFGPLPMRKPVSDIKTIIIDAGHGGGDPGGVATGKVYEKHLTLAIAKELKKQLEYTGRYKVVLTRSRDQYIRLRGRVALARKAKGDLFISIHADKIGRQSVRGASVYTLSETASDKETARLAEQENNAGVVAGVDLAIEDDEVAGILLDLAMRESMNQSKFFANLLVEAMRDNKIRLLNNTHRHAGFAVLKSPDIPSVLLEAGFLSSPKDAKLLQSSSYQAQLSRAIVQAVNSYFEQIRHLQDL